MEKCRFCDIYNTKKTEVIAENTLAFAIYDAFPVNEGHMLIIPKRHFENFFDAGIIDPTKVTRLALENAASIAGLLLTTEAVVSEIAEESSAAPSMPHGGGMGGMM